MSRLHRSSGAFRVVMAAMLLATAACGGGSEPAAEDTGAGSPAATTSTPPSEQSPSQAEAPDKVTVGGLSFLTGKFSSFGEDVQQGMELAVKKINQDGGVLGDAEFVLDLQDTASDSTQAVSLLRQFAGNEDIVGVVGPVGTPDLLAIMPVSEQTNIPIVSLGSQAPLSKSDFSDWVVRVNLVETPALLQDFLTRLADIEQLSSLALLSDSANDYAQAESNSLKEAIENTPLTLAGEESYQQGDTNFASQIDALIRLDPDAIWIAGTTNEAAQIMEQARARGFEGVFVGGAGLNDPTIADLAGDAASGYYTISPMNLEASKPEVKDFVDLYEAEYGDTDIATYTAYGYDATILLARAIDEAGTIDRQAVMDTLGSLSDVELVTGTYSFDGKGDNTTPAAFIFRMSAEGNLEPVE